MMLMPFAQMASDADERQMAEAFARRALETAKRLGYPRMVNRANRFLEALPGRSGRSDARISSMLRDRLASLDRPHRPRDTIRPVLSAPAPADPKPEAVDV